MQILSPNGPANPHLYRAALPLRLARAAAVIAAFLALSGCGTSEPTPETGTEIEDVQLDAIREVVPDADLERFLPRVFPSATRKTPRLKNS